MTVVTMMGSTTANLNDRFLYQMTTGAPTVTSVSPGTETSSGGDTITINGTNFKSVMGVTFGGTYATRYTVVSPTQVSVIAPSHAAGQVDVEVMSYYGTSATCSSDKLTFTTPVLTPAVTSLSANSGPASGGSTITIMGANFTNVTQVKFRNTAATSFSVMSSNSITAVVPSGTGTVDVTVTEDQNRELEQFLSQLPRLWQRGEVRPTHRAAPAKARDYRTREDPFEGVWSQLLSWIEQEPDATSKMLFVRLQELHPGKFPDGQLRTLQRRVRQ